MRDRFVVHVDIDAFFASVEQLHHPRLRGRPVIVGAGVIASCSYEARRHGLHAGMSLGRARELCPGVCIVAGDRHVYGAYAERVFSVLRALTPDIQTYLDEAYCLFDRGGATAEDLTGLGRALREEVLKRSGLSVSVGMGPSRMAAKLAGRTVKPGGVRFIEGAELPGLIAGMPVEVLPGVGPRTRRTFDELNIRTVADLRRLDRQALIALFGERGAKLHSLCRGHDTSSCAEAAMPRSISRETTFHRETSDPTHIEGMLYYLCERAARQARRQSLTTGTVSVRIRYADLHGDGASKRLPLPTDLDDCIFSPALSLLRRLYRRRANLRFVGVTLAGFVQSPAFAQLDLFAVKNRRNALYSALDTVRDRFGHSAIVAGRSIHLLGRLKRDEHGFVLRTPSLTR